jgi:DNA-binding GntR family transcriptional regulator
MRTQPRGAAALHAVDTRPLRQQIADALMQAILDGDIRPGEALIEMEIAQRLGVSRAPVREALQMLAHTSLVEATPYRGTTVRPLTRTDVEEVYSLRTIHETFALRRAMALDPHGTARELRAVCDDMIADARSHDWSRLAEHDQRFHEVLIERARHGLLLQVWRDIHLRVRQIMALRNRQNRDGMHVFHRHTDIVAAVEAGDVATATLRLEEHIASAADLVIDPPAPEVSAVVAAVG